jgi:hypothetical protein
MVDPRRSGLACCLGLVLACNPPAAREVATAVEPPIAEVAPACAPPPAAALALLADAPCPWILVADGSAMALRATDMVAPRALLVAPPEECAGRCDFTGTSTALGPLVIATLPDAASELPAAVFVGAALGGGTVRFAPLWFGRTSRVDNTDQGPSHALVPWVCGDALVLAVAGRVPAAAAEEPAPALVRAAGVYAIADDELRRLDRPTPPLAQCVRVPLELP